MKPYAPRVFSLLAFLALLFSVSLSAFAAPAQPLGEDVVSVKPEVSAAAQTYSIKVVSSGSVKKITVSATLYEKGLIFYGQVDTMAGSSSGSPYTCTDSYAIQSGKTYKIAYTVTVTYTDGTSETTSDEYVTTA